MYLILESFKIISSTRNVIVLSKILNYLTFLLTVQTLQTIYEIIALVNLPYTPTCWEEISRSQTKHVGNKTLYFQLVRI